MPTGIVSRVSLMRFYSLPWLYCAAIALNNALPAVAIIGAIEAPPGLNEMFIRAFPSQPNRSPAPIPARVTMLMNGAVIAPTHAPSAAQQISGPGPQRVRR